MSYKHNKKWRLTHTAKRNAGRKRYYQQYQKDNCMEGTRWSMEDIETLLFSDMCDVSLHFLLGRSVEAIQIKRHKL